MTSPLIQRILAALIADLLQSGQLVLIEGASAEALAAELSAAVSEAPGFSQFGPWLAGALLSSPLVDDLYATDEALSAMLREVQP